MGNCGHACEARPCGDAECRPLRERFTCRCRPGVPHPCPAPDDYAPLIAPPARAGNAITSTRYERAVPSFTGSESYLHYNDADTMKRYSHYSRSRSKITRSVKRATTSDVAPAAARAKSVFDHTIPYFGHSSISKPVNGSRRGCVSIQLRFYDAPRAHFITARLRRAYTPPRRFRLYTLCLLIFLNERTR